MPGQPAGAKALFLNEGSVVVLEILLQGSFPGQGNRGSLRFALVMLVVNQSFANELNLQVGIL